MKCFNCGMVLTGSVCRNCGVKNVHGMHMFLFPLDESEIKECTELGWEAECEHRWFEYCEGKVMEEVETADGFWQHWLGHCYYKGEGVEQDYEKAVECYRKSAEQGNDWAQY